MIGPLDYRSYAHVVLDLRSVIWGSDESCTIVKRHKFRARKCVIERALLTFSSIPNRLAYELLVDTYGLSLCVFDLFSWPQKRFLLSGHPPTRIR